jgi:hypothetical protein
MLVLPRKVNISYPERKGRIMVIVCSNCGQHMNGTVDMLNTKVRCPACMEWTCPQLPQATVEASKPELMGQSRLNDLVEANEEVDQWHNHGRKRPHAPQPAQPKQNYWYVVTDSGPKGPYTNKQIVQFAREGKINEANRLIDANTKTEFRAGDIQNLFARKTPQAPRQSLWYVKTAKGNAGPFPSAKIVEFAKDGKIQANTMLRNGNTGEFVAAGTVNGLIPTAT